MRVLYKLHRYYNLIEGEPICNSIAEYRDLISNPENINSFCPESEIYRRFNFYSMIDFRYVSYKESINQNFRPFKKR